MNQRCYHIMCIPVLQYAILGIVFYLQDYRGYINEPNILICNTSTLQSLVFLIYLYLKQYTYKIVYVLVHAVNIIAIFMNLVNLNYPGYEFYSHIQWFQLEALGIPIYTFILLFKEEYVDKNN